ncbi:hypothetical protein GOP47_0029012 [Adiantum capillus-veneris]|nr:hypothetical protein GOP47_0029012 [Adiantum capillus-veneris]
MGGIHHYNLLQLIGYWAEGAKRRLLVYKYMENGSWDQWIFASSSPMGTLECGDKANEHGVARLKWGLQFVIVVGVEKGLAYLHEECEKRIIHLDIKPQNIHILLDEGFVTKVADFGMSRRMEREETHVMTTMRATPGYLALEWLKEGTINVKCDVFSFGMILMELVSSRKNLNICKTEAPFYLEWAYSYLVSNKLLASNVTLDSELGSNFRDMCESFNMHEGVSIDELTNAELEDDEERAQLCCCVC